MSAEVMGLPASLNPTPQGPNGWIWFLVSGVPGMGFQIPRPLNLSPEWEGLRERRASG